MLEIIPTKLPHYVLPLYPAIAIIISYWMTNVTKEAGHRSTFSLNAIEVVIIGVIWFVVGLSFLVVSNFLLQTELLTPELFATPELIFSKFNDIGFLVLNFAAIINSLMFVLLLLVAYALFLFRKYVSSLLVSVALAWLFFIPVLQWSIPDLKWLFPSKQVAQIIEEHSGGKYPLVAIGYHEPSLVFYSGSSTALVNPEEGVKALSNNPYSYALVTKRNLDEFLDRLSKRNVSIEKIEEISSFNYSKGRAISLLIFFCSSIELK
jgi:4-amino-4-deoxy-L-arabinose transferase-like glycosyltransferase